uniref:Death domain-containing protein n=1 Tax=viral metagenome TaxID=1070528 RepID=A0A6C0CG58_9ZZZZ
MNPAQSTIPHEVLKKVVTDTGIIRLKLRKSIGTKWRDVGTSKEVKPYDLDSIDVQCKSEPEKAEAVLIAARGRMGSAFTISVLVGVLTELAMKHVTKLFVQ